MRPSADPNAARPSVCLALSCTFVLLCFWSRLTHLVLVPNLREVAAAQELNELEDTRFAIKQSDDGWWVVHDDLTTDHRHRDSQPDAGSGGANHVNQRRRLGS